MMKDMEKLKESFRQYAERTQKIRSLSSPAIGNEDSAENYSARLQENFRQIGELAAINRRMLDEELFPLLKSSEGLNSQLAEELNELADILLSLASEDDDCETLDLPISSLIVDRLILDVERKNDIAERIRRMDSEATVCYSMLSMTSRVSANSEISKVYLEKGMALGEEFLCMLDKDYFLSIPDVEMRECVLTNARFFVCFFERVCGDEELNQYNLDILDQMLDIAEDPFYHEAVPEFDWLYFRYRSLEYYVMSTEVDNMRGFTMEQLERIAKRGDELKELLAANADYFEKLPGVQLCPIHIARCHYLAGRISRAEYRTILLTYYEERDKEDFGMDGGYTNTMVPLELICLMDQASLTAEDCILLRRLYQGLSFYLFHAPGNGTISLILEYYSFIIDRFIDVPSGVDFEGFVLQSLAAMHPPTYVHSRMVGQITECLCRHLLKCEPQLFIGFPGCDSAEDVAARRDEILHYAYHAALCHDFGKIHIIDTIFVYGRKLLDLEFSIIRSHPEAGAKLLAAHEGTKRYADVARGHHKWYNDAGGYPEEMSTADSPYKTIIDLVLCADCMDAATDRVGRSYSKGKSLSEFVQELKDGAGERYAPWLPELLSRSEVASDVEYILSSARELNYRDTYSLLKDVQVKGGN